MRKIIQPSFDGIVVFDMPISIINDNGETHNIYGLLFDKKTKNADDLWQWQINRYICYLQAASEIQMKGGEISPEMWILPNGNKIYLNNDHKNLIYRCVKDRLINYRIVEYETSLNIQPGESEDAFLISREPLFRHGLVPEGEIQINEVGDEDEID